MLIVASIGALLSITALADVGYLLWRRSGGAPIPQPWHGTPRRPRITASRPPRSAAAPSSTPTG